MSGKSSASKKFLSIIFVFFLFVEFFKNGSYQTIDVFLDYFKQKNYDETATTIKEIENKYTSEIWKHRELIDINGFMAGKLNMHGLYSDMGMYITDDKYIVSASEYTSTDYEVNETVDFRNYLEENGINLLYVNEPTKYIDDELFIKEFGVETYSNQNADLFLKRIKQEGVNTIDLRDNIREENIDVSDLFYRTDHHWTTAAGLWATSIMADGLNKYCGYNIDTSYFDEDRFIKNEWKECWLGEQGRKMSLQYVGLDDYTELKPNYKTSFTFEESDGTTYDGNFDDFVDESIYNLDNDVYENGSWHYSYNLKNCINNNVDTGKVLIIGDSYAHVIQPFLSLQVHEVDCIILRNYERNFNLRDFIISSKYDTVIIAYAQFMIGAHDDPESANYRMFMFK